MSEDKNRLPNSQERIDAGPSHIQWTKPNLVTYGLIASVAVALSVDWQSLPFPLLDNVDPSTTVTGGLAVLMRQNASYYAAKIDEFTPRTPLDAKRANEQIKSLANAISGIAAAGVIAVGVRQIPKPDPDYLLICISVLIAFYVYTGARELLGRLKDENMIQF